MIFCHTYRLVPTLVTIREPFSGWWLMYLMGANVETYSQTLGRVQEIQKEGKDCLEARVV